MRVMWPPWLATLAGLSIALRGSSVSTFRIGVHPRGLVECRIDSRRATSAARDDPSGQVGSRNTSMAESPDPMPKATLSARQVAEEVSGLRRQFAPFFLWLVAATFVLIIVTLAAEIAIVFYYRSEQPQFAMGEKTLMAHLIRTSMGMILGLVSISLGVVMNWVAVEAPFTLQVGAGADTSARQVRLSSVGSAALLIVGGLLLSGFSLYAPMTVRTSEPGNAQQIMDRKPE